jgi:PhnB protein
VTSFEPQLWVEGASTAVAFYQVAFAAMVLHSVGPEDDPVVQLSVGQARFWVTEASEHMKRFSPNVMGGTTSRTLLVHDDPESAVKRAVDAGAIETSSVTDEHGWRLGRIVDPFGHEWEIGRPLGSWPPEGSL